MSDDDRSLAVTCWWAPIFALAALIRRYPPPVRRHARWSLAFATLLVFVAFFLFSSLPGTISVGAPLLVLLALVVTIINTRAAKRGKGPFFLGLET